MPAPRPALTRGCAGAGALVRRLGGALGRLLRRMGLGAAALAVAYPVLRDGLSGLKKDRRPSADTMPALAACGAALEAAIALLNARSYQTSSWTLLSGIAALGLFMALLGSRVQLAAVKNG